MDALGRLELLARSARYDVSCASSGSHRTAAAAGRGRTFGSAVPMGICHSFADDGRCVSLLKVLLSNACVNDCVYCVNRRSSDVPRAGFRVGELVALTEAFYRRNFIEGLFLSSGVVGSPDPTMEMLIRVARTLRLRSGFAGYIHLKIIPGCSPILVREAGFWADRLSVNIELPSDRSLRLLAPEKTGSDILGIMRSVRGTIEQNRTSRLPAVRPAAQRRRRGRARSSWWARAPRATGTSSRCPRTSTAAAVSAGSTTPPSPRRGPTRACPRRPPRRSGASTGSTRRTGSCAFRGSGGRSRHGASWRRVRTGGSASTPSSGSAWSCAGPAGSSPAGDGHSTGSTSPARRCTPVSRRPQTAGSFPCSRTRRRDRFRLRRLVRRLPVRGAPSGRDACFPHRAVREPCRRPVRPGRARAHRLLLACLRDTLRAGRSIAEGLAVRKLRDRVSLEIDRFLGFARFRRVARDRWYAPVNSDADIVGFIGPHFAHRFPDEALVVHDVNRDVAFWSTRGTCGIADLAGLPAEVRSRLSTDCEPGAEELWRKLMPVRYRVLMVECPGNKREGM